MDVRKWFDEVATYELFRLFVRYARTDSASQMWVLGGTNPGHRSLKDNDTIEARREAVLGAFHKGATAVVVAVAAAA